MGLTDVRAGAVAIDRALRHCRGGKDEGRGGEQASQDSEKSGAPGWW